ncbi:uracil-DNA glycosylase family protein [Haloferacaceae archaeon DSL9]
MRNVTDRTRNPFGMEPAHSRFVPGYGDANADFHVVGDHPGVHGGAETGVPFTEKPESYRLQAALRDAGLLSSVGDEPVVNKTFLSYLHMGIVDGHPTQAEYDDMERFFDAELRAIAAHVILPVGSYPTKHVLEQYTARAWKTDIDMEALHATELRGSGWLVVPIKEPSEWTGEDETALVDALLELQSTDYRRETDLGRFIAGSDPYFVR